MVSMHVYHKACVDDEGDDGQDVGVGSFLNDAGFKVEHRSANLLTTTPTVVGDVDDLRRLHDGVSYRQSAYFHRRPSSYAEHARSGLPYSGGFALRKLLNSNMLILH